MSRYVLGIDQSTQGTKALLFDEEGSLLCRCDLPHKQYIDEKGWVEHDPEEIYANTAAVVKNLVENAIRYNNDGGHVFVDIKKEDGAVKLIVKDDGIGIEDKYKQRIFERFYRVDKSRSREMGGTGLGLSIVKHICTLYNAGLTLESTLGVGTTITVSVPVANAGQE